jgi:hypothetical protein
MGRSRHDADSTRGVRDAVGRGTTFRSGARFGPEAIRFASGMIRIYNPVQKVQVFGAPARTTRRWRWRRSGQLRLGREARVRPGRRPPGERQRATRADFPSITTKIRPGRVFAPSEPLSLNAGVRHGSGNGSSSTPCEPSRPPARTRRRTPSPAPEQGLARSASRRFRGPSSSSYRRARSPRGSESVWERDRCSARSAARFAANALFEMLSLLAMTRRRRR